MIKSKIKKKMMSSEKGQIFFFQLRRLREKVSLMTMSDLSYIEKVYKKRYGKPINLIEPKGFGEKLQWLKLFYRNEYMPICSDKYELHSYLNKLGLGYLGNKVIGIYEDAKDIPFDKLPNKFVAKATHGSGWNLICKDKNELNWKDTVCKMNSWLKLNLYVFGREWNYKNIKPRIMIEEFIEHEPLNDYKFMCFNGEPLYMQLNNDYDGEHYVDFYDLNTWEHLPITLMHYERSKRNIPKPPQFEEMMRLARKLSKNFPFVRVDFYNFDETIILGELTFFPGGGLWPFVPTHEGYNKLIGSKLLLPRPNHNLEVYKKIISEKSSY